MSVFSRICVAALLTVAVAPRFAAAQDARQPPAADDKPSAEISGFVMLDIGHDFAHIDPAWFDVMRPSKLPPRPHGFGGDHNTFAGVRQSRLAVATSTPTTLGALTTLVEFDLFGVAQDAGQTTFHLRHAYGELGAFGAGQTWSPFADPEILPPTLDYWGPTGMAFYRNVQVRWLARRGANSLTLALERPGGTSDSGVFADRVALPSVTPRQPVPDASGAFKMTRGWGYFRGAGIVRLIKYDDVREDQFDVSGGVTGWGVNLSTNLKRGKSDSIHAEVVGGEGIQTYMRDSPVDVGAVPDASNPIAPVRGKAIPIVGVVLFLEHGWNDRFSSTIGYSSQYNRNTAGQAPDAFKTGHYVLGNLRYFPTPRATTGLEVQWGRRENFSDGFRSDGVKLQFSFRYSFALKVGNP
jgi:hypothetical protein